MSSDVTTVLLAHHSVPSAMCSNSSASAENVFSVTSYSCLHTVYYTFVMYYYSVIYEFHRKSETL